MMKLDKYAIIDGLVLVAVSISVWQWGHTIWVDLLPKGTTVVTMAVGIPETKYKFLIIKNQKI